jgi:UDP-2,3-diacylglucosamine pyrophosphatase LpxH
MQLYKENIYELSSKYEQCVLRIEHVLASGTNFKFYTGFHDYATFKVFFDFLQPACNINFYYIKYSAL